jgi:hypothetical protein
VDDALRAVGAQAADIVVASDVFHSGASKATPLLATVCHLLRVWHTRHVFVCSSFRSAETDAAVQSVCSTLGLTRTVVLGSPTDTSADSPLVESL